MAVGGACGGVWGGKKRVHAWYTFLKEGTHGTTLVHAKVHAKVHVHSRVHSEMFHTPGHPQGVRRIEDALRAGGRRTPIKG